MVLSLLTVQSTTSVGLVVVLVLVWVKQRDVDTKAKNRALVVIIKSALKAARCQCSGACAKPVVARLANPDNKMMTMLIATALKNRPSTAASSGKRCAGCNCMVATGRRQKCAKNIPPTQMITPERWSRSRKERILGGLGRRKGIGDLVLNGWVVPEAAVIAWECRP